MVEDDILGMMNHCITMNFVWKDCKMKFSGSISCRQQFDGSPSCTSWISDGKHNEFRVDFTASGKICAFLSIYYVEVDFWMSKRFSEVFWFEMLKTPPFSPNLLHFAKNLILLITVRICWNPRYIHRNFMKTWLFYLYFFSFGESISSSLAFNSYYTKLKIWWPICAVEKLFPLESE